MSNTNWADAQTPANASWSRPGGVDSGNTYDDSTVSYDDSLVYYDGFDATTITSDDVKFSTFTDAGTPATSAWTDIT